MSEPYMPLRQAFAFVYTSPNSSTENGDSIEETIVVKIEGEDLSMGSVLEKFKDFLRAVSYNPDKIVIDD